MAAYQVCSTCEEKKAVDEFGQTGGKRNKKCKACVNAYARERLKGMKKEKGTPGRKPGRRPKEETVDKSGYSEWRSAAMNELNKAQAGILQSTLRNLISNNRSDLTCAAFAEIISSEPFSVLADANIWDIFKEVIAKEEQQEDEDDEIPYRHHPASVAAFAGSSQEEDEEDDNDNPLAEYGSVTTSI